ncbi:MAG TPA: hypothetical protein VNO32_04245 [Candidatus Acidoferrum sp.]|nr:hypothetical protein [Candidatus Acidoferrum sp.]
MQWELDPESGGLNDRFAQAIRLRIPSGFLDPMVLVEPLGISENQLRADTSSIISVMSRLLLLLTITATFFLHLTAQAQANTNNPATPSPKLPFPTEVKHTVVFLETDCLHDFNPEIAQLTTDALSKMHPQQVEVIKEKLTTLIMQLKKLKQSTSKLTSEEIAELKPEGVSTLDVPQMGKLVSRMASLTTEDIKQLTPKETATLPTDQHSGTGFLVVVPDERLPRVEGQDNGFTYLITNRHVAQPGIEEGKPCNVLNYSVLLNRKGNSGNKTHHAELIGLGNSVNWHFSTNDSVDLAVVFFGASPDVYDFQRVAVRFFTTQEMVDKKLVVEGDPVMFSGLFIQTFQQVHSLEPIVRSGTLAMVPEGEMETTLHKLGRIYLTEIHAFAGNSGSPVFIDTNKFSGLVGSSYYLLGVISGEVHEAADFSLQVTTALAGAVDANSDVSMVVPADQMKDILYSSTLQAERDAAFPQTQHTK